MLERSKVSSEDMDSKAPIKNLNDRIKDQYIEDPDELFDIFLGWVLDRGIELYPAQEEAILEVFADNHVILNTPTGSGKSLVALAMHFYSFATGKRSYYTSPIKALVSEKFFNLCNVFGAENVGMSTGDAAINQSASIMCCTAEILAQLALSEGEHAKVDHVIMDEFHYYGDRERGMAWQLPLLLLPQSAFLLMSATLGDTQKIEDQLEDRTRRSVALVRSTERPVPLSYKYNAKLLVHTIESLVNDGLSPVYVVNFTQRETAELAQSLTSLNVSSKEEKAKIKEELKGFKFDTPYGKTIRKYLSHGVAIHHGGLLPKYRLLVEGMAQQGLLKIISGTDTLGVGINVPLRTVLFTKLCKYDGEKTRLLKVRDFKQIAGRAGRKGYDSAGLVIAQAPVHVIENLAAAAKADTAKKKKKLKASKPPEKGYVHWDEETFIRLNSSESEELKSRFTVNHAMLLNLLQREDSKCGYKALIDLIAISHESDKKKMQLRKKAKMLFKSLQSAHILEVIEKENGECGQQVRLSSELQQDFSIHHSLSLFLVYVMEKLNPEAEDFHLITMTFVESILEDPRVVLYRQEDKAKTIAISEMKAEGIDYDERMEKLETITWPQPDANSIHQAYAEFAKEQPWISGFTPNCKSVARDMYESYATFNEYVRSFGLERSEGVLLRHLSQTYKALGQNVPEQFKTEEIHDVIAYLREVISRADNSLVQEWERMVYGDLSESGEEEVEALDADMKAFNARVRAELRALVGALASDNLEEAAGLLRQVDPFWGPMELENAMAKYYEEYEKLVFDHAARFATNTIIKREGFGFYRVTQILFDPEGNKDWYLEGVIDLSKIKDLSSRFFALGKISNGALF